MLLMSIVQVFLSAANIRSQLLPFHGTVLTLFFLVALLFLYYYQIWHVDHPCLVPCCTGLVCLAKNALFCAYLFRQASMSSRLEAGEHLAGWEYGSSPQDMRLWLLKGTAIRTRCTKLRCLHTKLGENEQ